MKTITEFKEQVLATYDEPKKMIITEDVDCDHKGWQVIIVCAKHENSKLKRIHILMEHEVPNMSTLTIYSDEVTIPADQIFTFGRMAKVVQKAIESCVDKLNERWWK